MGRMVAAQQDWLHTKLRWQSHWNAKVKIMQCCLLLSCALCAKGGHLLLLVKAENSSMRMKVWRACAKLLQRTLMTQTRDHAGWEGSTAMQAMSAALPPTRQAC